MCGIYKIINLLNQKIYIGCSINIERRWNDHKKLYLLKNQPCYNYPIYKAFRKYGIDNFRFEIIEETEKDKIFDQEKYWIKYYNSNNPEKGYNCTEGGDSGPRMPGSKNPNAKLNENDVYQIRFLLMEGKMLNEVYQLYSNKISLRGFQHIWRGESWPDVYPEAIMYVKSKEYISKVRSYAGKQNNKNMNIKKEILQKKQEGLKRLDVYESYKEIYSIGGFNKIWYEY